MIEIIPCTRYLATWIAANIRDKDRDELLAAVGSENVTVPAVMCNDMTHDGMKWVVKIDGEPVAAFGIAWHPIVTPTVGNIWLFGTDKIRRAIPTISRHFVTQALEIAEAHGITRLEVRTAEGHDISHRWLARLGADCACHLHEFGTNGETFLLYEWTRSEWHAMLDGHREKSPWLRRALEPCRVAAE